MNQSEKNSKDNLSFIDDVVNPWHAVNLLNLFNLFELSCIYTYSFELIDHWLDVPHLTVLKIVRWWDLAFKKYDLLYYYLKL